MVAEHAGVPSMTVEEYRALERAGTGTRHEYLQGHVVAMAGGTRRHSQLAGNAYALLAEAVGGGPCRVYTSDMRVRLAASVQVYPDATVTCDERDAENDADDEIGYPRLVVEVLSPTTERVDRGRKLRDYQACPSVEEYALVNGDYQAIEVFRRQGETWTYHRYEAGSNVEFVSIGLRRPLTAFYQRTAVPTVLPPQVTG